MLWLPGLGPCALPGPASTWLSLAALPLRQQSPSCPFPPLLGHQELSSLCGTTNQTENYLRTSTQL